MNRFRMKQDVLQIVIPVIIVSLILQGDLMAKRAAQLTVEKIGQEVIKGKLPLSRPGRLLGRRCLLLSPGF